MLLKRLGYLLPITIILVQCSTKKNTLPSRAYHNLTARYNGYYYSNENLDEGVYKIEKNHKENFDKIIPIYIYPTPEKAKSTFPDFDKAIKKSSLCIQKHAIKDKKGNEIASAGKWIDNNWINIGISHFYKREFFSAIEAFEYVIRTYNKSDDKYTAMLWLIKANNEIGSVSSSEPILSLLKNNYGKLPSKIKSQLPVVTADYYIRRGQNSEAVARLMEATRNSNLFTGISKKKRARYSFIIAQLAEESSDNKRAMLYYRKTIALKPSYELVFYSKIKLARMLDVKRTNSEKTKKDLLKMAKDNKNSDYYDVIYYTLGEIEEKEKNISPALRYYQKSVQTSTNNPNQKALSYLKLGEINFDLTNYQPAEAYYDSTISTLPKDHPQYNSILARKKTLETLVGYIKTISKEDSLQRIAKMSEADRNRFIDKLIEKQEKEEEKRVRELEAQKNVNTAGAFTGTTQTNTGFNDGRTSFYFYNPNTVALGISEFTRRWGYRKLEDNWRRANKAATIDEANPDLVDTTITKTKDPSKLRLAYLNGLPVNDSLIRKSNNKIIKAYYLMGSIYKEELHNSKKTIASFEELNTRFPDNRYLLKTYYLLYRTYLDEKNQPKADFYKNKILEEFPDSEFALLIKNPDYSQEINAKKSEVENFYNKTFASYTESDYPKAYELSKEGITKYGNKEYLPKFEFIKAVSHGKIKGVDTLEQNLKLVVARFPESEITPLSKDILLAIKKQKIPEPVFKDGETGAKLDTFALNLDAEHFIAVITPDDSKISSAFVTKVGNFNTTYYSDKKFNVVSNLFGASKQLVIIKSFPNAKEAVSYWENLQSDPEIFKDPVKKNELDIFPIQADNLQVLYKRKNVNSYKIFFEENYKLLGSKN